MRHQRLDAEHGERRRGDRHHDKIGRGRRHPATKQDADDRRHHEGKEQRQSFGIEQALRHEAAEQRRNIGGRAGDDGRQLEADAGQRDDADDDADRGSSRADADRIFRADYEGIEDVEEARLASLVAEHKPCRHGD